MYVQLLYNSADVPSLREAVHSRGQGVEVGFQHTWTLVSADLVIENVSMLVISSIR